MIILTGLAGSGKSTQGQILAEKTGRVWLSVGQILRETGEFDEIMNAGQLVDDMLTVKIMANKMAEVVRSGRDAVLDGFPRDVEQAEWIAENIAEVMEMIIKIEVPKEELINRLMLRGRADDTRAAIERRFEITEQNLGKIYAILGEKGIKLVKIDGVGTIEEVAKRVAEAVSTCETTESRSDSSIVA